MYLPRPFQRDNLDDLHELIRQYNFATLFSQVEGTPYVTHLPFMIDLDRGPKDLSEHKDVLLPQLQAIVGFEIPIEKIEGKYKFNQNRSIEDQQGVIRAFEASSDFTQREVADMMKGNLNRR